MRIKPTLVGQRGRFDDEGLQNSRAACVGEGGVDSARISIRHGNKFSWPTCLVGRSRSGRRRQRHGVGPLVEIG